MRKKSCENPKIKHSPEQMSREEGKELKMGEWSLN
jgi:hypothetical protein